MRDIGQALSNMASDAYRRLCAGAVWVMIHVYVRVLSSFCAKRKIENAFLFSSHLVT